MADNLFDKVYNPDVLSCLANLSNDEVFTPPDVANKMLDMLPQELFSNPNTTFLDPACKSGIFLREIAKRLIKGLEKEIPDLQERLDHIFHKQLYGIAITEMTSLLSRRSVYCSKYPNSKYSASKFDDVEGNIRYRNIAHTWVNGKCKYCGAAKSEYGGAKRSGLETHAYEFIHALEPEEIFNMKFDVIIGNPPYQLSDGSGGSTDSAMPIYNKFIDSAIKLSPKFLCMITPSKWMVGGRGLQNFRERMMADKRIKIFHDYENASECFSGIHIDGGVSYFLWEREYDGEVEFYYHGKTGLTTLQHMNLKNKFFDYVVRDGRILSILEKVSAEERFNEIVSFTKPFGVRKYLFNNPERYPNANLQFEPFENAIKIYGVKGLKGGARRVVGYVSLSIINDSLNALNKYKLFFTTSYSTGAINYPEVIKAGKSTACTETFLVIGPFETEDEQENCLSYMNTSFFKVLLYYGKGTMQVNRSVFGLIPLQDFSKPWADEELYKKYNLSADEIAFIESMIKPMDLGSDVNG